MRRSMIAAARPNARVYRQPYRNISTLTTFTGQVATSTDDAYEYLDTGTVDTTYPILLLGYDGAIGKTAAGMTLTGVRFSGVTLAQAASVPFAQLRFVSSNGNSEGTLRIWCEDADNASAFNTTASSLSARTKTTAYVDWTPGTWVVDQDDAGTLSPDLGALVQEVVNRPGWSSGNALVFLIELSPANTATYGRKRAWSYDGASTKAVRLSVNTTEGSGAPDPTPSGDFSDGYDLFGLLGRNNVPDGGTFDPTAPNLKDGTAFTSQMGTDYAATLYWALNNQNGTGYWDTVNSVTRLGSTNSYNSGYSGQPILGAFLQMFRLTGDLRFLDAACLGMAAHASTGLTIAWDGHDIDAVVALSSKYRDCSPNPSWSPYEKGLYRTAGWGGTGTDLNDTPTGKLIAIAAEFAWALWLNRNLTSPGGYDYGTLYSGTWKGILEGYVSTWSGPLTDACWCNNYWGDQYTNRASASRRRAGTGEYPFYAVNGSHSSLDAIVAHRYIGLLGLHAGLSVTNPQDALDVVPGYMNSIAGNAFYPATNSLGDTLIFMRSNWFYGFDERAGWATYTGKQANMFVKLWLMGAYRANFTLDMMRKLTRSYTSMHNTDGSTLGNIAADQTNISPLTNTTGDTQTVRKNSLAGYMMMVVFEDSTESTKLETVSRAVQTDSGGYVTPNAAYGAIGLFTQAALNLVGDLEVPA